MLFLCDFATIKFTMTDEEIVQGVLARNNRITGEFFFVKLRPLLASVVGRVYNGAADIDEKIGEFYEFLMENDGERLRKFEFRSSLFTWIKVVSLRFFIRKRNEVLDLENAVSLYNCKEDVAGTADLEPQTDSEDVERLLGMLGNQRYADAIRALVLRDEEPQEYAESIGVSVENIYNIKKRAIAALARIAHKYYEYGR